MIISIPSPAIFFAIQVGGSTFFGYHQQKRWLPDFPMSGWDVDPDDTDLRQVCSLIFQ
jgi:hypothetical protein